MKGYETYFPMKQISRKRMKDKIWITKGLKISSCKKNKLYQKYIKKPTVANKIKYRQYKKIFDKLLQKAQVQYYNNLIDNTKASIKTLWNTFGPIVCPRKGKQKQYIHNIMHDGKSVTKQSEIAEIFNSYFCNIGTNLEQQLPKVQNNNFCESMPNLLPNSMFLEPVSEEELLKLINNLKSNKSIGEEDLPIKIFKECKNEIKTPLLKIFNCSLQQGCFPDKLKIVKVIPLR